MPEQRAERSIRVAGGHADLLMGHPARVSSSTHQFTGTRPDGRPSDAIAADDHRRRRRRSPTVARFIAMNAPRVNHCAYTNSKGSVAVTAETAVMPLANDVEDARIVAPDFPRHESSFCSPRKMATACASPPIDLAVVNVVASATMV